MRQHRRAPAPQTSELPDAAAPRAGVRAREGGGWAPCGRVSIVTPTTDQRQDFHEQLYSVFDAQDWEDKELIVIETHRSRPSPFLKEKAKKDARVVFHSLKISPEAEDLTIGTKRNMGTHLASGDWIASFDDDDLYAPSYLPTMLDAMVRQNAGAITLGSWYIFEERSGMFGYVDCRGLDGSRVDALGRVKPADRDGWLYGYGFSYIFSRDSASDYPFPDKNFGEDYDFFIRLKTRLQTAILYDDFGICVHTLHPRSTSSVQAGSEVYRDEIEALDVAQLGDLLQRYMTRFPRRGQSLNIGGEKRSTHRPLAVHLSPFGLEVPVSRRLHFTAGEARKALAEAMGLEVGSLKMYDSPERRGAGLADGWRLGVRVRELWATYAAAAEGGKDFGVGARVLSAGFDGGNYAEFYLGEEQLSFKATRGLNIVTVDPATMRTSFQSYDLWMKPGEENRRLASDLTALKPGHVALVAVKDTGIEKLSPEAVQALRRLGSTLTGRGPCFREGYALIGRKGGAAVAERRGPAVVALGILWKDAPLQVGSILVECADAKAPDVIVQVCVEATAKFLEVMEALQQQHCAAALPEQLRALRLVERLGSGSFVAVDPNAPLGDARTVLVMGLVEAM